MSPLPNTFVPSQLHRDHAVLSAVTYWLRDKTNAGTLPDYQQKILAPMLLEIRQGKLAVFFCEEGSRLTGHLADGTDAYADTGYALNFFEFAHDKKLRDHYVGVQYVISLSIPKKQPATDHDQKARVEALARTLIHLYQANIYPCAQYGNFSRIGDPYPVTPTKPSRYQIIPEVAKFVWRSLGTRDPQ